MDWLVIVGLICCGFSGLIGAWCCSLLVCRRRKGFKRLIWAQLLFLGAVDLCYGVYSIFGVAGCALTGEPLDAKIMYCGSVPYVRDYLEMLSCVIEVHIAGGFAAAVHGYPGAVRMLYWTLPLCFGIALGLVVYTTSTIRPKNWRQLKQVDSAYGWAFVVFCCAGIIVFLYLSCLCRKALAMSSSVRARAVSRAATYFVSFMLTFGLRAIYLVTDRKLFWLDELTLTMVNFNGAIIVGSYTWWMLRRPLAEESVTHGSSVSIEENLVLERYFDLTIEVDDAVANAARLVASSVLEANRLRRQDSDKADVQPLATSLRVTSHTLDTAVTSRGTHAILEDSAYDAM